MPELIPAEPGSPEWLAARQADEYIAKAAEDGLSYTRARIREMQDQVRRMKVSAERIAKECNAFLTGETFDEEAF